MKKTLATITVILITLLIITAGAALAGETNDAGPTPQQVDELRMLGIQLGDMGNEVAASVDVIVALPNYDANTNPISSPFVSTRANSNGEDSTAGPTPQQLDELRMLGIQLGDMG